MSSLLRTPPVDPRAFLLRPPALTPERPPALHTDEELTRALQDAAQGAEARVRDEMERLVAELEARTAAAADALLRAAAEARAARADLLRGAAAEAVELALAVARRVVRHEIATDPEAVLPLVRELLQRVAAGNEVVLRLSPRDHATVAARLAELPEGSGLGEIRVRVDGAISPGGCIVETPAGSFDGTVETQLERIEEALRARPGEAA